MSFEKAAAEAASKIQNAGYTGSDKGDAAIAAAILAHAHAMDEIASALRQIARSH